MWKVIIVVVFAFLLFDCTGRPRLMNFEVFFYAPLGTNINEIGNNYQELKEEFSNQTVIYNDYIDVPTSIQIYRNRIFIADKYNKKVVSFSLSGGDTNVFVISNRGEGYEFDIPLNVVVNKYGEIYVLGIITNVMINEKKTNSEDFQNNCCYIYKFSPGGKFIYAIGENGVNSGRMPLPERIDIDLFDNLYVYIPRYDGDYKNINVKRYSISGELTFDFDTKYISKTNYSGDEVYLNFISTIHNLKNDERLVISSRSYLIRKGEKNFTTPENFYNVVDVYSILKNAITRNIFKSRKYYADIMIVTYDDIIVLSSYDERAKAIKFEFVDISGDNLKKEVYYMPPLSSIYHTVGYWVDKNGNIYSIVVKGEKYFVILKWKKVKSRA